MSDNVAEPSLLTRLQELEARLAGLERGGGTGLSGTDQTIKGCHDRLDALLGAGKAAPDGTLVSNLNADLLDGLHAAQIDADTIDGYHASEIPASYIRTVFSPLREEFLHSDHIEDFYPAAINSGTRAGATGTADHPGVVLLRGATGANSGYALFTSIVGFLIAGGEEFEIIFKCTDASSENRARFGWGAASDATAAPKGVYIRVNGTALDGYCKNASGNASTGTTYTYAAGTWYRARIVINAAASRVDFYLYNAAGTQLWTDYLTTYIPTAAGDEVGVGAVWYQTSTTQRTCTVDWMTARINRTLTR